LSNHKKPAEGEGFSLKGRRKNYSGQLRSFINQGKKTSTKRGREEPLRETPMRQKSRWTWVGKKKPRKRRSWRPKGVCNGTVEENVSPLTVGINYFLVGKNPNKEKKPPGKIILRGSVDSLKKERKLKGKKNQIDWCPPKREGGSYR